MFFSSYFVFTENGEMAVFAILWCAFSTGKEAKHRDDSEEIGKVLLLRIEHRLAYQFVFHQLAPLFPSYLYDFSRTAVFLSLSFAHSYPSDCPLIPWSLYTFPTCNCKIIGETSQQEKIILIVEIRFSLLVVLHPFRSSVRFVSGAIFLKITWNTALQFGIHRNYSIYV